MKIAKITGRQILDSRGNPTVEADVILEDGTMGRAAVPSGASTGTHEALELRDGDKSLYLGKSVLKAVDNVNTKISQALIGKEVENQSDIDQIMIDLDGTENKSSLGANAILAVSLASAKAASYYQKKPLYQYFHDISKTTRPLLLPLPMMNIMNGGKHGNWATDIQEYMILPIGATNFSQALQMGTEIFHALAKVLDKAGYSITVGDEGGFAPQVKNGNKEPLDLISQAIVNVGYELGKDIVFGIDAAASEFFKDGKYYLKREGLTLTSDQMTDWLVDLVKGYPIVSLEDCLDQNDWPGWSKQTAKLGNNHQIVGDDLFVTNVKFLEKGVKERSANAILIKLNQIGTLTETINCVRLAQENGWNTVISHRSGETEDTTIADLGVGLAAGQIKTGSVSRTDRVAKYNQLLRIEEQLGKSAKFAGKDALK